MLKNCIICGGVFDARGCAKTCSLECRAKRQRDRQRADGAAVMLKNCVICSAVFGTAHYQAVVCSAACKALHKRNVARAWHAARPQYRREQRLANLERERERDRKRGSERGRKWRAEHPGYGTAYNRKYRAEHPEYHNEYMRVWRAANPDKKNAQDRRYRAKRMQQKIEKLRSYLNDCQNVGTDQTAS